MKNPLLKNLFLIAALVVGIYFWLGNGKHPATPIGSVQQSLAGPASLGRTDSHQQVHGYGVVVKVLPDDTEGNRHQKFILKLPSGQTVLVAHNIDLAPRVAPIARGDTVEFSGEYVWNERGGIVHWTHHDPSGRHEGGWLKADGRTYQ